MVKVRQDAWSHEDDLLLAETVLRHIREGSTQLKAFDEVGDKLNRTSAACGFRWNAEIRRRYEQAVAIAKRQRKEKKRAEQAAGVKAAAVPAFQQPAVVVPQNESFSTAEFEAEIAQETFIVGQHTEHIQQTDEQHQEISLKSVIAYLEKLEQDYQTGNSGKMSLHQLDAENHRLRHDKELLEEKVAQLQHKLKTMQEDYQVLIQIMDRARKMVIFDEKESFVSPAFRMDKNGNLEQVAK